MSDFKLGSHEAQIMALRDDVSEMKTQIREQGASIAEIREFVQQVRGGWKAAAILLTAFGAFLGSVVAVLFNVAQMVIGRK